jgi:hypothetical protein
MFRSVVLLSEVAERLDVLTIACGRCDRRSRLRVVRLMAEYGTHAQIPTVLRADCPHRDAGERERCDPYCPDLVRAFLPD